MIMAFLWEIKMDLHRTFRYHFGLITDIIVYFGLFTVFMITDSGMSYGEQYGYANYKGLILLGYIAWIYAVSAISNIANSVHNEAAQGILYKKISSKYPLQILFFGLLISSLILETGTILVVVLLTKLVWGVQISFHAAFFLPLLVQTIGMYGIGLLVAGLAVYYKKTGAVVFLIQTALLFVTDTVPTNAGILNITKVLPLTNCNYILKKIITGEPYAERMILLIVTSVLWIVVGSIMFRIMLQKAKKRGNLLFY